MKQFKFKILNLSIITLVIVTSSCKKEEDVHANYSATITITSPEADQKFDHHSNVTISGKIESDDELHGYKLVIRQLSDGAEKFSKEYHVHGKKIEFNEVWMNMIEIHQDMELEVIVVIDHDGNTISKKVVFHCRGMNG